MNKLKIKFRVRRVNAGKAWGVTILAKGKHEGDEEYSWYPLDMFRDYREAYSYIFRMIPLDSGCDGNLDHCVHKDRDKAIRMAVDKYADFIARQLIETAEDTIRKESAIEIKI